MKLKKTLGTMFVAVLVATLSGGNLALATPAGPAPSAVVVDANRSASSPLADHHSRAHLRSAPVGALVGSVDVSQVDEVKSKKKKFKKTSAKISGKQRVGATLKANPGDWGTKKVKYSYQWLRNGKPISKATKSTYKLKSSDMGKRIRVEITGSKKGFSKETKASKQTKKIQGKAFKKVSKPKPTGDVRVGKTLKVNPGDWGTSKVKYSYQWLRNGKPIKGATKSSYKLKTADAGKSISVRIEGKKKGYKTRTVTSSVRKDWKTVTRTATYRAVDVFGPGRCLDLGNSFFPCVGNVAGLGSRGNMIFHSGYGDVTVVGGGIRLEGAPQRWRATFNGVRKTSGPSFIAFASKGNPRDFDRWADKTLVEFNSGSYLDRDIRGSWSKVKSGRDIWLVIGSVSYLDGGLYFDSITIEYDTIR